jgi:hypothetical protein
MTKFFDLHTVKLNSISELYGKSKKIRSNIGKLDLILGN